MIDQLPNGQSLSDIVEKLFESERFEVAGEIQALQAIYGDSAVQAHEDVRLRDHLYGGFPYMTSQAVRYDIESTLAPAFEDVTFRLCVSIPASYPSEMAPQLQLLSKYIGDFGVDTDLWATITRTFISTSGVAWSPGEVVVFDGVENVRAVVTKWYTTRLSEAKAGAMARDEEENRARSHKATVPLEETPEHTDLSFSSPAPIGIQITQGDPIHDRGSSFIARVCHIDYPSQVPLILDYLRADRHIARAAHPTINAWRCEVGGIMHSENDDDGESAAGSRLAHLLQILELDNVLVVVTRYFGGVHLGPDRFKHINQCARGALELGGFLAEDKVSRKGRKGSKKR